MDYQGQVIGINSAKYTQTGFQGMGFSIPITDAMPTIQELIKSGVATHPALLVSTDDQYNSYAQSNNKPLGAYIANESSSSNAWRNIFKTITLHCRNPVQKGGLSLICTILIFTSWFTSGIRRSDDGSSVRHISTTAVKVKRVLRKNTRSMMLRKPVNLKVGHFQT